MAFPHTGGGDYFIYNNQRHPILSNDDHFSPTHKSQQPHTKNEFDNQASTPYYTYPSATPNAPSHHRGWSESTTSTHISSGKPFLSSSSLASKKRSHLLEVSDAWSLEIITVAVALGAVGSILGVLAKFNGNALPEWPYYITLNALIALLAAVTTAAMNISLQNSMSQLKWIHFKESRARLSDMEAFDEASRGTWGAIKLLFTARGG